MKSIKANWPAPPNISALTTTRIDGYSLAPFDSNNLGLHVGDNPEAVLKNRLQLKIELQLANEPLWLNQTHSTHCIIAEQDKERDADAAISHSAQYPLAIMTADCLPIALCNQQGDEIAIIHAGWKGLAQGIIENTLRKMTSETTQLMAWIGPAICHNCFEVGDEVYKIFCSRYPFSTAAFTARKGKWLADLALIAELILKSQGVLAVFQSNRCTFESKTEYYSYRREPQTGRIATLIWFNDKTPQHAFGYNQG